MRSICLLLLVLIHTTAFIQANERNSPTNQQLSEDMARLTEDVNELKQKVDSLERLHPSVSRCPDGWVRYGSSCYGVGSERVTWGDAQEMCEVHGGHLAEIEDRAENEFVKGLAHPRGFSAVWLGGIDVFADGHWIWASDGRPVTFSDWYPGEQTENRGGSEDCVTMDTHNTFRWFDARCSSLRYFVCET